MKRIWTPWRIDYILAAKDGEQEGCLFCNKLAEPVENDRANLILRRRQRTFTMLNLYPYTNGHLMVVPYEHAASIEALPEETAAELMTEVQHSVRKLREMMAPDGFNVGINIGRPAGAGVEAHVHIHVVPRWVGDSNFMAVIADTRLIPEDLQATYERLLAIGFAA